MTRAVIGSVGPNGGRPRPAVDERDLAEEVARAEVADGVPVLEHLRRAAAQDEERVTRLALAHEVVVNVERRLAGQVGDRVERPVGHPQKSGTSRRTVSVTVMAYLLILR